MFQVITMTFAAIYARSSLGKAKQGDTVEHQVEMIQEYANRFSMSVTFEGSFRTMRQYLSIQLLIW